MINEEKLEYFYTGFRIIIGLMFLSHGLFKLFGGMTGLMLFAGVVETVVGALVAIGYLSRYAAGVGVVQMGAAYVMVHVPKGWNYFTNGGEPALLFLVGFLAVIAHGSGKFSFKKWEPW